MTRLNKHRSFRLGVLAEHSITPTTFVDTARRAQAAAEIARKRRWHAVSPEQILFMPAQLIGTREQIVDALLERWERYAISYIVVSDADLDTAAPIVAQLAGR